MISSPLMVNIGQRRNNNLPPGHQHVIMIGKAKSHLGSGTASSPRNRHFIPESNVLGPSTTGSFSCGYSTPVNLG